MQPSRRNAGDKFAFKKVVPTDNVLFESNYALFERPNVPGENMLDKLMKRRHYKIVQAITHLDQKKIVTQERFCLLASIDEAFHRA